MPGLISPCGEALGRHTLHIGKTPRRPQAARVFKPIFVRARIQQQDRHRQAPIQWTFFNAMKCRQQLGNRRKKAPTRRAFLSLWLRGPDLNQRPLGYEPNELPDCSTPRQIHHYGTTRLLKRTPHNQTKTTQRTARHFPKMVAGAGFEPTTFGL